MAVKSLREHVLHKWPQLEAKLVESQCSAHRVVWFAHERVNLIAEVHADGRVSLKAQGETALVEYLAIHAPEFCMTLALMQDVLQDEVWRE